MGKTRKPDATDTKTTKVRDKTPKRASRPAATRKERDRLIDEVVDENADGLIDDVEFLVIDNRPDGPCGEAPDDSRFRRVGVHDVVATPTKQPNEVHERHEVEDRIHVAPE